MSTPDTVNPGTTNHDPVDRLRADDPAPKAPPGPAAKTIGGVAGWLDDRTGAAKPVGTAGGLCGAHACPRSQKLGPTASRNGASATR